MTSGLPEGYTLVDEPQEAGLPSGYKLVEEPANAERVANFAKGLATEVAVGTSGQALGAMTGPGYFVIAPAAGAYGNYLKQKQELDRGDREDLSWGEMVSSALINTIPGSAMTKVGGKVLGKVTAAAGRTVGEKAAKIGGQAALRGAEGAVIGAGGKTVETAIDERRWPTYDEYLSSIGGGAALGGAVGAAEKVAAPVLSKAASKMWNRFADKTEQQVAQELSTIKANGSPEERQAAAEIIDEVGQRMGLVAPSRKSAVESAGQFATPVQPFTPPTAAESAGAFFGDEAVAMAQRQGRILSAQEQAAIRARAAVEQARLQAEARAQGRAQAIPSGFGSEQAAMAGSRPASVTDIPGTAVSPRPMGGFGGSGAEGTPVAAQRSAAESAAVFEGRVAAEAPQSAQVFERAYQEGRTQAGAQGLRERLVAEQQAAVRAGDFPRARQLDELAKQIEANRLMRPEQVPSEQVLRSTMVKPGGKVGGRMGTDLPTQEDIMQEFQNVPGVGGRAGAREMGLAAAGAPVAAGVAAAMAEGGEEPAKYIAPVDVYEIEHPDPRIGSLRFNAKDYTEDKILQEINKREIELAKIDVAMPSLRIREEWQKLEDAFDRGDITKARLNQAQFELLSSVPIQDMGMAMAARIGGPIAGEFLARRAPGAGVIGRVGGAMVGEVAGQMAEGRPFQGSDVLASGIAAVPGGQKGQFAKNLMKFAGFNMTAEAAKEAIARGDLMSLKQAAAAAAEGGGQAVMMKVAGKMAQKAMPTAAKRGNYELIRTMAGANELGFIVDPSIYAEALPTTLAMKLAGGSTRFQEAASRVNYPRLERAVERILGAEEGTSFGRQFFFNERERLSKSYKDVAAVSSKAATALDDWKAANESAVVNARMASMEKDRVARIKFREAAKAAREDADKAFKTIETEAVKNGQYSLAKDLTDSRRKMARMYAIKSMVKESSGKIEYPGALGELYDAGATFDGDLLKLARISSTMSEVLQAPPTIRRENPIKAFSDVGFVEGMKGLLKAPIKSTMAAPEAAMRQYMMSQGYQRGAIMGPRPPGLPEQLGRFLGQETMQQARPVPYR